MPRLAVNVNHTYSVNRPLQKLGPTGRPIRNVDGLVQKEAREPLISPRFLARMALLILIAGLAVVIAWWRVTHFPH
jgi:hypothetical protein